MNVTFESIEQAAGQLNVKERAALAHSLLKGLDYGVGADVEALWIEAAKLRLDAYRRGEMEALLGDEVMERLKNLIRR